MDDMKLTEMYVNGEISKGEYARSRLIMWLNAEEAVATGQSYKIGSRELKRVDLSMIKKQIEYWSAMADESPNVSGGRRTTRITIRDL